MAAMSNYLENELVKHIFRTGSFTKPSALYVALYTSAPSDSGGGTEVSGGSYARAQLDPSDSNWAATSGSDGKTSNSVEITFAAPTGNWGTITHFGIFDASTSGNLLIHGALTVSKTVNNADAAPKFAVNALEVTFA